MDLTQNWVTCAWCTCINDGLEVHLGFGYYHFSYADFILIVSKFYPDKIRIKLGKNEGLFRKEIPALEFKRTPV